MKNQSAFEQEKAQLTQNFKQDKQNFKQKIEGLEKELKRKKDEGEVDPLIIKRLHE